MVDAHPAGVAPTNDPAECIAFLGTAALRVPALYLRTPLDMYTRQAGDSRWRIRESIASTIGRLMTCQETDSQFHSLTPTVKEEEVVKQCEGVGVTLASVDPPMEAPRVCDTMLQLVNSWVADTKRAMGTGGVKAESMDTVNLFRIRTVAASVVNGGTTGTVGGLMHALQMHTEIIRTFVCSDLDPKREDYKALVKALSYTTSLVVVARHHARTEGSGPDVTGSLESVDILDTMLNLVAAGEETKNVKAVRSILKGCLSKARLKRECPALLSKTNQRLKRIDNNTPGRGKSAAKSRLTRISKKKQ
ncbi:hypothetical protein KIPB_012600 [Kipferlia bialata]|uniref:Uncharacterized protein n=1 Tax=Kipferlia bialata TaxID=797122 RepID=A0A9K3D6D2_9EUKA|nr:hypothetical protein KIPB_012600 [Kipferlia bialata]|eukprot:g12600.t1